MSSAALEPKPLHGRVPDLAPFKVRALLKQHPEYGRRERLVALCVAFYMGRKEDGWYHATLSQSATGALGKETGYKRGAINAALRILCAEGGIFRAVPRYDYRGDRPKRLANDYVLVENPGAYAQAKKQSPGEVVAMGAAKESALELCREYARCYRELRHGAAYEASRKDRREAMHLLREYPDRAYLRDLLRAYLTEENHEVLGILPGHQGRLLSDARRYLKVADERWRANGVDFVPVEDAPDPEG